MHCPHCGQEYAVAEHLSACPSCLEPLGGAETEAGEGAARPLGVGVVVVLYSLVAACEVVFGLGLVMGVWPPAEATQLMGRAVFVLIGVILAAMGAATLITGRYLWSGFDWARSAFMVFVALGGLMQVSRALRGHVLSMLLVAASVLFLLVLNGAGAKEYCSRTELRGATPVVVVAVVGVLAFGGFAVLYFVRMS